MPRRKQDRPKRMKWEDPSGKGADEDPTDSNGPGSDVDSTDSTSTSPALDTTTTTTIIAQTPQDAPLDDGSMISDIAAGQLQPPPPPPPPLEQAPPLLPPESPPTTATTTTAAMTPLVNQATSAPVAEDQPLDFSVHGKQRRNKKRCAEDDGLGDSDGDSDTEEDSCGDDADVVGVADGDAPLDLSVPRKRSSTSDHRRSARNCSANVISATPGSWANTGTGTGPAPFPFRFMTSVSPSSSVELPLWNGHQQHHHHHHQHQQQQQHHHHHHHHQKTSSTSPHSSSHSPATTPVHFGTSHNRHTPTPPNPPSRPPSSNPSHPTTPTPPDCVGQSKSVEVLHGSKRGCSSSPSNAWQSHWLSRGGAHQAKEVLTCVWCRRSFRSLEELTVHMKEARHCGVGSGAAPAACKRSSSDDHHHHHHHHQQQQQQQQQHSMTTCSSGGGSSTGTAKDSVSLPRKLVRGQDVWLGKGAEQTKQILKCMWCGQSFKSLAEMTTHMQQTQHYTNIISQEQIISWKSPEDKASPQAHVNAVLTCKVCDQAFSSLKELSNHMVKNAHYKEHILRSITESGGRRRAAARERRKKALPVRKLLELERAQQGLVTSSSSSRSSSVLLDGMGVVADGKVTCEKCTQRIDASSFVEHIRQCLGAKNSTDANHHHQHHHHHHHRHHSERHHHHHGSKSTNGSSSSSSTRNSSKHDGNRLVVEASSASSPITTTTTGGSSAKRKSLLAGSLRVVNANSSTMDNEPQGPSVLNAIEKLIEKSFEYKRGKSVYASSASSAATTSLASYKKTNLEDVVNPVQKVKSDASDVSGPEDGAEDVGEDKTAAENKQLPASSSSSSSSSASQQQQQLVDGNVDHDEDTDGGDAEEEAEDKELEVGAKKKRRKRTWKTEDRTSSASASPDAHVVPAASIMTPASAAGGNSQHSHSPSVTSRPASGGSAVTSGDDGDRSPAIDLCTSTTTTTTTTATTNTSGGRGGGGGSGLPLVCTTPPSPSSSDHPLRELQKLLDKTNVSLSSAKTPSATSTVAVAGGGATAATVVSGSGGVGGVGGASGQESSSSSSAGALLAFSWACSDLVMSDSVIKCAFCDTPFISKGAYRHHLSKMHFVKDATTVDGTSTKCPSTGAVTTSTTSVVSASGGGGSNSNSSSSKPSASPPVLVATSSSSTSSKSPPKTPVDESPHSKFLKYTELAKQLSSKYV